MAWPLTQHVWIVDLSCLETKTDLLPSSWCACTAYHLPLSLSSHLPHPQPLLVSIILLCCPSPIVLSVQSCWREFRMQAIQCFSWKLPSFTSSVPWVLWIQIVAQKFTQLCPLFCEFASRQTYSLGYWLGRPDQVGNQPLRTLISSSLKCL